MDIRISTTLRTAMIAATATATLLTAGCHGGSQPGQAVAATTADAGTTTPASAPAAISGSGSSPSTATGQPAAATIPGSLYFVKANTDSAPPLAVLKGSRLTVVARGYTILESEVAPDGRHLAYVDDKSRLIIANGDGSGARVLHTKVVTTGYGPVWTADSASVVFALATSNEVSTPGIQSITSTTFRPLPKAISDGIHYRLSGDGQTVFYSDGVCHIDMAHIDGTHKRVIPILGSEDSRINPKSLRACDIVSTNGDGSRITVDLHRGDDPDGDIGGSSNANALIDTVTGKVVPVGVKGAVQQMLLHADGTMLVATQDTVTLFSPQLTVLATMKLPATVKGWFLYDWSA